MNFRLNHHLACAALTMIVAVSAQAQAASKPPMGLDEILRENPASPEAAGMPSIRFNAIRETAVTFGAQAGLARRSYENLARLDRQAHQLDVIYNFQALLMEGNVVPPVLSETSDVYDQSNDDLLRVIGKVFRIEQQARFSYAPPTWRAYLMMGYEFDKNVVAAVSPQNDQERNLWKTAVEEGFKLGSDQADSILKENFARLQRDFLGMVKYHQMLEAGMVTKPYVASTRQGVIRADDGSMHVGEVFLRITASPDFVGDPTKWNGNARSGTADRLRSAADPELAARMLKEAQASGMVKDKGR
ncbi:type IV secretory system conjugative DNA transfer family protein [Paucibacter soli]|uniref:type IV secretory system conjugative DNA transfer family protein n=1 Tax=Paucibacter soli TaxID=3133433 RepID=UPI0030AAFFB3